MHSDGSYLSVIKARSRAAGQFHFGDNKNGNPNQVESNQGSTHQECSVIKPIVAPVAECETATLFVNCQTELIIRTPALEIGYQQPARPIQFDNITTCSYVYNRLQQKRSKLFDMKLYWLKSDLTEIDSTHAGPKEKII